jgi:hypothetical protein
MAGRVRRVVQPAQVGVRVGGALVGQCGDAPGVLDDRQHRLDPGGHAAPFGVRRQRLGQVGETSQRGDLGQAGAGEAVHERLLGLPGQPDRLVGGRHRGVQVAQADGAQRPARSNAPTCRAALLR